MSVQDSFYERRTDYQILIKFNQYAIYHTTQKLIKQRRKSGLMKTFLGLIDKKLYASDQCKEIT